VKLITFVDPDGNERPGVVQDDEAVTIDGVGSIRELFEQGPELEAARAASGRRFPLAEVRLKAPIVPRKLIHTSGNFREHEDESKNVNWSHAIAPWIVFFQNVDAIIGPDEDIVYPEHLTRELDHELELAVVMARSGKFLDEKEAEELIGGFLIFNDITARDIQRREMKSGVFSFCKSIDTFCPLGPWIVTPDEVGDSRTLEMRLTVNGDLRQHSYSGNMSVTLAELIAHHSPLGYHAGDVLTTGTVSGVAGFKADKEKWYLRPGDVVECSVERVGTLRNRVVSWQDAYGEPAPAFREW
jgi:2-keto-4-pentenoate hydratase/2-oxohepta-3-ene-1,7-dioic acid hydratase in catechol pathway